MAKICPETNTPVLYLACLECENKVKCKEKTNDDRRKNKGTEETKSK